MRQNFLLIDFENVQPESLDLLDPERFSVLVFLGATQTKIPVELALAVQRMGPGSSYVKMSGSGPNALDFHIAFYIGQLSITEPNAYFHILSKDAGFDPLIQHLKAKKINVKRVPELAQMPVVKAAQAPTSVDRCEIVASTLQKMGTARPRTIKTLGSTVSTVFRKTLTEAEVAAVVAALQKKGLVTVDKQKVSYSLPKAV